MTLRLDWSSEEVAAHAALVDLDPAVVAAAVDNVARGDVVFLVVSGKLASGKDTVAPAVLGALGFERAEHLYYALPLKEEMDAIIGDLRSWFFTGRYPSLTPRRRAEAAALIAARHNLPVAQAGYFAGRLLDQVRSHTGVHARSRTKVMRGALQFHGTEVRRAQDSDYWVKRALKPALTALASGSSVYFTDARFPNEVSMAARFGAYSVRLDISPEVQRARLLARDGMKMPSPESLTHDSEVALDDYPDFSIRVDNNGPLELAVRTAAGTFAQAHALSA